MENQTSFNQNLSFIFKALALAMFVATIVLNLLGAVDLQANALFIGIGIFCLGISTLDPEDSYE